MSKNWYAAIKVAADETTPEINFHIGKTGSNTVSVDGNLFASFAEMVDFLRYNESKTVITDEYGVTHTLAELEELFLSYSTADRGRQYRAGGSEHNRLDKDGFTVTTGVWF